MPGCDLRFTGALGKGGIRCCADPPRTASHRVTGRPLAVDLWPESRDFPGVYNVIVAYDSKAWETDQLMRMDADRFKEYSGGPESDQVDLKKPASLKLLERIPTLLFYEGGSEGPSAQLVRFGTVSAIHVTGGKVVFRFVEEGRFSRTVLEEFSSRLGLGRFEQNRTHWAVKEGGIPRAMLSQLRPTYDIVFSFAGENRIYVGKVARYLRTKGVKVFFDEFESVDLWGKDLAEHFSLIYGQSARYCVIFISDDYVKKMWTRHERRAALARAVEEHQDYILPARFDDTPVDGIRSSLAYISLAKLAPVEFAKQVLRKLGRI